jgi:thiopeptide-type bacteriocin biosynthesis protein
MLGSEWLYYKLYCGQKVANHLLLAVVAPLTRELQARQLIDNWFFVRYADPDNHLRLRLHLPDPTRLGEVIQLATYYFTPYQTDAAIWKMQTDTYRRELERYGKEAINLAEQLFGYQSTRYLDWLARETISIDDWLWGAGALHELLQAFGYSTMHKAALLRELRDAFGQEFRLDKNLKRQFDAKYRLNRVALAEVLSKAEDIVTPEPLQILVTQLRNLAQQNRLEVSEHDLLKSYIHMLLNRVIPAQVRLHELVIYDFLTRHYQSQQARQQRG